MKCPLCADDDARLARVWERLQEAKRQGTDTMLSENLKNAPAWFLESLKAPPEAPDFSLDELEHHLIETHLMTDEDEREQFGEHYSHEVQAQIDLELREGRPYRIRMARQAIEIIREDKRHWPTPNMMEKAIKGVSTWQTWPLSYGFRGLLEYIETGETHKIMDPTLRRAVKKAIFTDVKAVQAQE